MEGVIPNSKVVIYPPPPGSDVSASGWRRELYLRPGAWIPLVTLTVVVVTAILAVVVGVLHWNEKVRTRFLWRAGGWKELIIWFPVAEGGRTRAETSVAPYQFRCTLTFPSPCNRELSSYLDDRLFLINASFAKLYHPYCTIHLNIQLT